LKNNDLLRIAKMEDVHSFVNRQRSSFVARINQKENTSILKRLLYNDDDAKKRQNTVQSNIMSKNLKIIVEV
jgi:hypothetical protein